MTKSSLIRNEQFFLLYIQSKLLFLQINLLMGDIMSCVDDTEKAIQYNKTEVPALVCQQKMCGKSS